MLLLLIFLLFAVVVPVCRGLAGGGEIMLDPVVASTFTQDSAPNVPYVCPSTSGITGLQTRATATGTLIDMTIICSPIDVVSVDH